MISAWPESTPGSSLPRDMGGCPSPISSVLSTPPHGLTRLVGSAVAPRDMSHYLGCDLIWNHGLCGCHSGRGLVLRSSWICQGLKSKHLCHQATGEETDHEQQTSKSVVLWGSCPGKHSRESSVCLSAWGICRPGRPTVPLRSVRPLSLDRGPRGWHICQTTLRSGPLVAGSVLGRHSAGPERTSWFLPGGGGGAQEAGVDGRRWEGGVMELSADL